MTGPAERPGGGTVILVALAAISALGSLAIHMLVPALPALAHDLALGQPQAQLAISVYLAGLGCGQLLAGPLTDRAGRRPVLLVGLVCYSAGAFGTLVAHDLATLLAARLIQALGGAAGVVTARVMVSDIFGREESARRQATLMMIVLISPALAPVVGGLLAGWASWRAIPAALGLVGLAALAVSALRLRESAGRRHAAVPVPSLAGGVVRLLRNREFVLPTLTLIGGSSALYMFLGSAAFLLVRNFGLSEPEAGACFLAVAASSIAGTQLVGPLGRRCDRLVAGAGLILSAAVIELALALAGLSGPAALIGPMVLLGLGAGIVGPSAIALVIFAEESLAGTAASLAGASQMLASAAATGLLGQFAPIDQVKLGLALAGPAALACCAALYRTKSH